MVNKDEYIRRNFTAVWLLSLGRQAQVCEDIAQDYDVLWYS